MMENYFIQEEKLFTLANNNNNIIIPKKVSPTTITTTEFAGTEFGNKIEPPYKHPCPGSDLFSAIYIQPFPLSPKYHPNNLAKILERISAMDLNETCTGENYMANSSASSPDSDYPSSCWTTDCSFENLPSSMAISDVVGGEAMPQAASCASSSGAESDDPELAAIFNEILEYEQLSVSHFDKFELDFATLKRRQKQIDYGKIQDCYQAYLERVPKHKRGPTDPTTPNKFAKYSRRAWDGSIKAWKIRLHNTHNKYLEKLQKVHLQEKDAAGNVDDDNNVSSSGSEQL